MALLIWPVAGVELVGWSASNNLPHADGFYSADRPLYFVTHFYAHQPDAPFQLTINLKVNNEAIFSLFLNKCAMIFFCGDDVKRSHLGCWLAVAMGKGNRWWLKWP